MDERGPDPPTVRQRIASSLFEGLLFKVATGLERDQALHLRCEVYARDWPAVPLDKVVDSADTNAHQLIALTPEGEAIASLRIITSDQRPFDMEHFISLDGLIPTERSPAEIGRLCVKHGNRHIRSHSFVQLGIFKLGIDFSLQRGATDLLLTALPTLRNIYGVAGFAETGTVFEHSSWGLVHVMRLDLLDLLSQEPGTSSAVRQILRSEKPPNFILE